MHNSMTSDAKSLLCTEVSSSDCMSPSLSLVRPRLGTRLNKYNRISVTIDRVLLQPVEKTIHKDSSTCGDVSTNYFIGVA